MLVWLQSRALLYDNLCRALAHLFNLVHPSLLARQRTVTISQYSANLPTCYINLEVAMCQRFVYTNTYKGCTATPKHKIIRYDPQPPCGKENCGGYKDVHFGSTTNKPGICPKC